MAGPVHLRRRVLSETAHLSGLLHQVLKSLLHGAKVESVQEKKALTLAGWFDWLAEHDWPETLDEKTIGFRTGRFNNHVRDIFGAVPLTKIDSLQVRTFYKTLRNNGVGHATIIAIKADLVRAFNQAITPYGRVPMSHANPFRLTIQSAPLQDAVAITPEQAVAAIICKKLNLKERAILASFLLVGLRLSEQMALTREQLLFDQNLIYIDRAVKLDKKSGQTVRLPKGNKKRLAVMCPTLKAILCEYAGELAHGAFLWPAENNNKPRMKKSTYDVWVAIVANSGLPADMSPHDCRLSHINWIEKLLPEVSPTTLKEHVGHASGSSVTEISYTRPLTPAQDILRNGIELLVTAISSKQRYRPCRLYRRVIPTTCSIFRGKSQPNDGSDLWPSRL